MKTNLDKLREDWCYCGTNEMTGVFETCQNCIDMDNQNEAILKDIKPIIKKHCMGTGANCYTIYQEIENLLKGEKK